MVPYTKFTYIWPPRPETTIQPMSPHFEAMKKRVGWVSQLKLNGQRNTIYIGPDGEVQMWNRHHELHGNYNAQAWVVDHIKSLIKPTGKWMAIDGELLHNKDKTTKNLFYWWDMLVYDDQYLLGTTYGDRHKLLYSAVNTPIDNDGQIARLSEHIWLAMNIQPEQYDDVWKRTETSYVEGFVFKNLAGKLTPGIVEKNNNTWMVRCRKTHAGGCYSF